MEVRRLGLAAAALLVLTACTGQAPEHAADRSTDRGFRCADGRIILMRETDPAEVAVDLGDRKLYLRRQASGQAFASGGNSLVLNATGAVLTTPPAAATNCLSYDPHSALPPRGAP